MPPSACGRKSQVAFRQGAQGRGNYFALAITRSQLRFVQGIDILARLHANGDRHNSMVVSEVQEILSALANEKHSDGGWKELVTPCTKYYALSLYIDCR